MQQKQEKEPKTEGQQAKETETAWKCDQRADRREDWVKVVQTVLPAIEI